MCALTRRELLSLAAYGLLTRPRTALSSSSSPNANPFLGTRLYVDPQSHAADWVRTHERTRPSDAKLIRTIAEQPTAIWAGWRSSPGHGVRAALGRAAGALCVFVAYNIPDRDLGSYSGGGAADAEAYRGWFTSLLSGVQNDRAVLIFEPDALAHLDQLRAAEQSQRMEIFQRSMTMAAKLPQLAVYIDAGHPEWQSAEEMGRRLRQAGVEHVRGFSLNVSNFIETSRCLQYGRDILAVLRSQDISGKSFVIDTSRNGAGPFRGEPEPWCNPPGRALGDRPGDAPAPADALLWIKPPGDSDGTCRNGPHAGAFWPEYALGLASRAAWSEAKAAPA